MQPKAPSSGFSWFPEQASTFAASVDYLYFYLVAVSVFFTVLIAGVIVVFSVKYRQRSPDDRPERMETSKMLEVVWSVIPFILVVIMFFWGAEVFFAQRGIPNDAMTIHVTGKKWMWKFQHLNGQREINVVHVPVGRPIVFQMSSEDVIHDVFIPAFRTKQDVLPGRYTKLWFEATKTGVYHLFCNQYCGTQHSNMVGSVVVMEESAYQAWLSGYTGETPEKAGEALFTKLACNSCHMAGSASRGPDLAGLLGTKIALADGETIVADENYLRESILDPQAKVVAGFEPIMPSFQGIVSEDQVTQLIAYISSLQPSGSQQHLPSGEILDTSALTNQADAMQIQPAPASEREPEQTPEAAGTPSSTPEATPTPTPEQEPVPTPEPAPTPPLEPAATQTTETQNDSSTTTPGSAVE